MAGFGGLGFPLKIAGNPGVFLAVSVGTQWETCGKTQRYTLKTKTSPQKKVLSLVLCVAMLLSVMVMGTGAAFTDEDDFSPQYQEAAEVLTGMKVMQGYDDGSFLPQRNITRAQVATMIYRAATGDVDDSQVGIYADYDKFDDVQSDDWFAGYVNFCANAEYIKGFDANTFGPNKNVTGYQALAMILRAVGYDQNDEFTGPDWAINTASIARDLGILKNVDEATLGAPASRELVAELIFQAMNVPTVTYTPAFGYDDDNAFGVKNATLGEKNFELAFEENTTDDWGRPGNVWYQETSNWPNGSTRYNGYDKDEDVVYATIEDECLGTFIEATSDCDIATAMGVDKVTPVTVWTNGVEKDDSITPTDTAASNGGQGTLIEVYASWDPQAEENVYSLVIIDTYLARVDKVNEATYDDAGHEKTAASSDLTVWFDGTGNAGKDVSNALATVDYTEGSYLLINYNEGTNKYSALQEAESFVGAQSRIWWNASQHTIDGETYDDAAHFVLDQAGRTQTENFTWFLDQYGNVIGNVELGRTGYAVLKDIIWNVGTPGYAEATLVYMDGTEDTVTVNTFDGLENDFEANDWPYRGGNGWDTEDPAEPTLSDSSSAFPGVSSDTKYNAIYEGYALYVVTTNDDGTVNLDQATEQGGEVFYDYRATLDTNSSAIILGNGTRLTVTANTEFLVRNSDNTYSACTRADLPELAQNTEIFYTADKDDVAECVYVKNGVNEAELGSHLFVITDNYSRIAGEPNTFEMVVNVDGVERTIATNEANVKYLAANEGKLFHVTWELNPYAGFYGFVDELRLVNDKEDNEPTCDYMSTVTYKGDTLYNANNSYTVDADTVIVGNNGVIDDSKGIWVLCDDNKTTHADVVFVGTKLDGTTSFATDSDYEVVYDKDSDKYVITIPYTETDNDVNIWAVAQNGVLVYNDTAYRNLGYNDLCEKATLDFTGLNPGENMEFAFTIWAEDGVTANNETVTLMVKMTNSDQRSGLITGIADGSIICDDEAAGYTSVDKAPVLPLDISKANELTISLVNDTVKASWATYTSTALAENGKASDFTAMGATLSTSVLDEGDILVLKIEKVEGQNPNKITLDDGYTTAPALYVVYQINK